MVPIEPVKPCHSTPDPDSIALPSLVPLALDVSLKRLGELMVTLPAPYRVLHEIHFPP